MEDIPLPIRLLFSTIAFFFIAVFGLAAIALDKLADLFRKVPEPTYVPVPEVQLASHDSLVEETAILAKAAEFPDETAFAKSYFKRFKAAMQKAGMPVPESNGVFPFISAAMNIYDDEHLNVVPSRHLGIIEGSIDAARLNDTLIARRKKLTDPDHTIGVMCAVFDRAFLPLAMRLPKHVHAAEEDDTSISLPLYAFLAEPHERIREVINVFRSHPFTDLNLFEQLRRQLDENEKAAPSRLESPRIAVEALLRDTPLQELFEYRLPFSIPLSKQLEHSMIAAGSRYGKSQLIGSIIAAHLQSDKPPGIIVVNSTGDFAEKISQVGLFAPGGKLDGKLLVLDPADAPQLNMFDLSTVKAKGYRASELEQVEADVINLFNYVFASIGSDLTAQQGTGFNFLVRLLLSIPGSNIHMLREILELPAKRYQDAPEKLRAAIERLDLTTQAYFRNQFFGEHMLATRQGVARRLYGLLQIPTFERMFSGGNRIDFFQAMQDGKVIVVNTAKSLLQPAASALFGRYIIARVMSGAFERPVIKDMNERRPCLLFIDEAQEYFDGAIDTLLTQIGKFKLGICLAFQYLGQMDDKLRASILGNTTVKYAGGLNVAESRMIAKELRVDDDFVLAQRKDASEPPQWAQFATHVKYSTDHAVSITVPFYALEKMPKMSDEAHRLVMEANKRAVAGDPTAPIVRAPPLAQPSQSPRPIDDEIATEW